MANFTQNLSDSIRFLAPATKFGSPMKWGVDLWGSDVGSSGNFSLPINASSFHQDLGPTLIDLFGVPFTVGVSDTISFSQGPMQSETLRDKSGLYFYVFSGGFTNDEYVSKPNYVTILNVPTNWTLLTNSSTSWVTA